jgi:hypothetical protein
MGGELAEESGVAVDGTESTELGIDGCGLGPPYRNHEQRSSVQLLLGQLVS